MKCIICRKVKDNKEFSYEHVIPESMGGFYIIQTVCKDCNSHLGNTVDCLLTNHLFSKFFRQQLQIPGKTGKIPNPFDGTHFIGKNKNIKTKVFFDKQGIVRTDILHDIKIKKDETGIIKEIKIMLDGKYSQEEIDGIIKKILSRNNLKIEADNIEYSKELLDDDCINIKIIVDKHKFKIGLLKIAYEFASDSINEFLEDKNSKEISNFLLKPNLNNLDKYFIGYNTFNNISKHFSFLFDTTKKKHILILTNNKQFGLLCYVLLYGTFAAVVKLSKSLTMKEPILVGVNDLENKKFYKLSLSDFIEKLYLTNNLRFGYYFKDEAEANNFLLLEKRSDFKYYEINGEIPFFDSSFDIKYKNLESLFEACIRDKNIYTLKKEDENILITRICLSEELYIKVMPTNQFCQVIEIELSQKIKKID